MERRLQRANLLLFKAFFFFFFFSFFRKERMRLHLQELFVFTDILIINYYYYCFSFHLPRVLTTYFLYLPLVSKCTSDNSLGDDRQRRERCQKLSKTPRRQRLTASSFLFLFFFFFLKVRTPPEKLRLAIGGKNLVIMTLKG